MPHQHHFLSRLDRLSLPHVELALSLYRDPGLVRYVLHEVRLPERAERVALSLEDPRRGPFLVVTREGVFVTCLGQDMSPGDLPVVPRGQLDGLLAKAGDYRSRAEVLLDVAEELGGGKGLFRRLFEAGEYLSREEMIALSALQPLYSFDLFTTLLGVAKQLEESRQVLLPALRRAKNLSGSTRELLRVYHDGVWLVGHLSVLVGMSSRRLLESLPDRLREEVLSISLSWGAVRQGMLAVALRGAWLAARTGKDLVPSYKRDLPGARSAMTALNTTLGLAAIALRHGRLRAEIEKALASVTESSGAEPARITFPGTPAALALWMLARQEEVSDAVEKGHIQMGAELAMSLTRALPRGSPYAFERPEDVPSDLALTLAANATNSLLADRTVLIPLYAMLPWVARASAEDLYLPRDFLRATRRPWTPEATYNFLRPLAGHYKPVPERPAGPARKGPCPCGSGKKYKRCCGAEA